MQQQQQQQKVVNKKCWKLISFVSFFFFWFFSLLAKRTKILDHATYIHENVVALIIQNKQVNGGKNLHFASQKKRTGNKNQSGGIRGNILIRKMSLKWLPFIRSSASLSARFFVAVFCIGDIRASTADKMWARYRIFRSFNMRVPAHGSNVCGCATEWRCDGNKKICERKIQMKMIHSHWKRRSGQRQWQR